MLSKNTLAELRFEMEASLPLRHGALWSVRRKFAVQNLMQAWRLVKKNYESKAVESDISHFECYPFILIDL